MTAETSNAFYWITTSIAATSAGITLSTAIFADWIKERFGIRGAAKLRMEIENRPPYFSHCWFRGVSPDPETQAKDVCAQVLRISVANVSHNSAKNVSMWMTGFCSNSTDKTPDVNKNIMGLRWADTWRFVMDKDNGTVLPSDADLNLSMIPADAAKYCDLCLFYVDGPDRVDRFERGKVYFCVFNMPARTFSFGAGRHEVEIQASAENARAIRLRFELNYRPESKTEPLTVSKVEPLRRKKGQWIAVRRAAT